MRTKQITIQIPARYCWKIIQPWGKVEIHQSKPQIHDGGKGDQYWQSNQEYIELPDTMDNCPHWRKTLEEI